MNVFKISIEDSRVRKFLERRGWENQGKDNEMEMDSYKHKTTGKKVYVEDISDELSSYPSHWRFHHRRISTISRAF